MTITLEPDYDNECECVLIHERFVRNNIIVDNHIIKDIGPWHWSCKKMLLYPYKYKQKPKFEKRVEGEGMFFDGSPDSYEYIYQWMMHDALTNGNFRIDTLDSKITYTGPMWIVKGKFGFRPENYMP